MRKESFVLAIDCGTQSVRAMVFDKLGTLLAKQQIALHAYTSPQPGWAEQHPDYFWQQLSTACQQLWQKHPDYQSQISGLALTCQRGSVVFLDKQGMPLRSTILWLDQRRATQLLPLPTYLKCGLGLLGLSSTLTYLQSKAQANWVRQHQPEIWSKTTYVVYLSGYLLYKLTGEWVDSTGAMVGYLPFDYKRLQWAKKGSWRWSLAGVSTQQLSKLYDPGALLGHLSPQAAEVIGLKAGLPVFAAASDKACEVLGAGAFSSEIACLSYGTTATINTTQHQYVEPIRFIPPYPAAIPKAYNTEIMVYRGFWMVSWFKREFGKEEQLRAKELGVPAEKLFDELLAKSPPGAMGLTLQPYWSPALKQPFGKGAIIGFGDVHTRAHLYRAIVEGLAYALRAGKEQIEARSGITIKSIRVSGGGAQSDAVLQLTADIFNLPVKRPHTIETSGLGAAINAYVGLGVYSSYAEAIAAMTRCDKTFLPHTENVKLYNALYGKVYKKMFGRLRPLYKNIQQITSYPSY
ncbi:FGGY-family carbohydrate kinase [Zooshikella marina]|uniref:FGGY-family carbohydrate kinase n=1 Tax=Zooshikella ganghwensis TaxID=202772 RepID=UPI001BB05DA6|nr:FGGY-family carbohydrate kinase [Zooshikella ganghwensis]MBU2704361.1 FGGY-family carbohydrate kinase [Zooshikella ganghwensis]